MGESSMNPQLENNSDSDEVPGLRASCSALGRYISLGHEGVVELYEGRLQQWFQSLKHNDRRGSFHVSQESCPR